MPSSSHSSQGQTGQSTYWVVEKRDRRWNERERERERERINKLGNRTNKEQQAVLIK